MDLTPLILLIPAALLLLAVLFVKRVVVYEYQQALLYRNGKVVSVLAPGQHFFISPFSYVQRIDTRELYMVLPGQEVLTSDNIALKISLVTSYRIIDPYLAITRVASYTEALHLMLQLDLRDIVGSMAVDELLARRAEIGKNLLERSVAKAKEIGLELTLANIRDIMFPGELKNIFAQVVNARNEGLAALERARGESAALRNLANAARLLDGNPSLRQLRLLQTLENKSGNTVILLGDELSRLAKDRAQTEQPD